MRFIYYLFIAVGVALILGTAGASDLGSITIKEILKQLAISSLLISYGIKSLMLLKRSKASYEY